MSSGENPSPVKQSVPLIYRLHRWFFAASIVLGPAFGLAAVVTGPGYSSTKSGPVAALAATMAASTLQLQISTIVSTIGTYLFPVGLLAMAWLGMRRAPWWASSAMLVVFLGVFPFPAFIAQNALYWDLARIGSNPVFNTLVQHFNDDGVMGYYSAVFLLGTILGPILLGVTLWRARIVPIWAAVLIIISRPLIFSYLPFQNAFPAVYFQATTWLLFLIGSLPAALAMLKGKDEAPALLGREKQEAIC
jgi:hypothetical protein